MTIDQVMELYLVGIIIVFGFDLGSSKNPSFSLEMWKDDLEVPSQHTKPKKGMSILYHVFFWLGSWFSIGFALGQFIKIYEEEKL